MNPPERDQAAAELQAMQDAIYREKILRARRQTPAARRPPSVWRSAMNPVAFW